MADRPVHEARAVSCNGWSEGYAEGYAAKLVDVTEPFTIPQSDFQMEAAARWVHSRLAAHITYADAIGLVRGMIREGMKESA